jgi:adenosine/AMP kinase
LVRSEGTDRELVDIAKRNALAIGCGHSFIIYLRGSYPINVLNRIKMVQEVCQILAATSNPLQAIVLETNQGRGLIGVVDGEKSLGIETEEDKKKRIAFLRDIGYKIG